MKNFLFILVLALASCLEAAWYWPFTPDEDSTNTPPRLHRLLEQANDYIELAEDESLKGEADKALDYYHQALDELFRVQRENPERAEKPEFAPLRNKIAACRAAVDAIRFDQINSNIRAVTVSDTAELQRKWNRLHGVKDEEETGKVPVDEKKKSDAVDGQKQAKAEKTVSQGNDAEQAEDSAEVAWKDRLRGAANSLRAGDVAAASATLDAMEKERPEDLDVLMLHAAALASSGRLYAARKRLETAAKAHPRSYLPHYNLAYVALELGEGRKVARRCYEAGREVGGPVNADLEKRLK